MTNFANYLALGSTGVPVDGDVPVWNEATHVWEPVARGLLDTGWVPITNAQLLDFNNNPVQILPNQPSDKMLTVVAWAMYINIAVAYSYGGDAAAFFLTTIDSAETISQLVLPVALLDGNDSNGVIFARVNATLDPTYIQVYDDLHAWGINLDSGISENLTGGDDANDVRIRVWYSEVDLP